MKATRNTSSPKAPSPTIRRMVAKAIRAHVRSRTRRSGLVPGLRRVSATFS